MMGAASVLAKLRRLLMAEAPQQSDVIQEALRRSARTGNEHSVVGSANVGGRSVITEGDKNSVIPNKFDLRRALSEPVEEPLFDFHTHPSPGYAFGIRPSEADFIAYANDYNARPGRELRTLVATPPYRGQRTSYNYFATDKPSVVFDPRMRDLATHELQRAAQRGIFDKVKDNEAFWHYFDSGNDMGGLLKELSPLLLLRHRATQGLGRHELELGNAMISPDPRATNNALFEMIEPTALEYLRSKKFAQGGLAQMKECNCHAH